MTIENAGAVVALVGRNGAGKSNILQAIAQTAKMATSSDAMGLAPYMRPGLFLSLDFNAESASYRYSIAVSHLPPKSPRPTFEETLSRKDGEGFVEIVRRSGGTAHINGRAETLAIGEFSACLPAISTVLPSTDQVVIDIKPARSFLTAIRYYPLNEPIEAGIEDRIVQEADYARWVSVYESGGGLDELFMRMIYMQQKRPEDFSAFEQLVGPNGLGLIDKIVISKVSSRPQPATEEQFFHLVRFIPSRGRERVGPPLVVGYNALSLGTRRVLRLLVSMLFDKSSVMLLEQPEDSLHQGLTKKVIGILQTNAPPAQLIFASHSSALLNKLRPEEIRIVSLHNGFTEARRLTTEEVGAASRFMNEEGTLYDFLDTVQED